MHGKYICPDCFREYPVKWEEPAEPVSAPDRNETFVPSALPVHQLAGTAKRFDTM
jgi:hypothetical protein